MKRVSVNNLKEGMVLSDNVYLKNQKLLVPKGVVLTQSVMMLLKHKQITSVLIDDNQVESRIEEPESYVELVKTNDHFRTFKLEYENDVKFLAQSLNDLIEKNEPFDTDIFIQKVFKLLTHTGQTNNILDFLISMRDYDDSTFCHSMNVALLCGIFADWLSLNQADRETAILCGLFHDIGKLKIPLSIIKKTTSLTDAEFAIMKKHSELGYQILRSKKNIPPLNEHVPYAALMHHEKCDGTGYPLSLKGEGIDFFAKMVAIVDVYDAMTSKRVYRAPLCPFTVIHHFEEEGLQKYDPEMLLVFLNHVVNTYINHTVKLSNGKIGNIIFINKICLSKPMIKCEDGFIDLTQDKQVYIEEIL